MTSSESRDAGGPPPPLRADARRNRARILAAAEQVFAEQGSAGSTEEIARRAGVATGTVFRHFPTKQALLQAIVKDLLRRLTDEAAALADAGDPATALFTFFADLVGEAAAKKSVVDLLGDAGGAVSVDGPVQGLQQVIALLLTRAQDAGSVRDDVEVADVMALLVSTTQGAVRAGWESGLQDRVLTIVFDGLRPGSPRDP